MISDAQWAALRECVDQVCNRETDRMSTYAFSIIREDAGGINIHLNVPPGEGIGDHAYLHLEPEE